MATYRRVALVWLLVPERWSSSTGKAQRGRRSRKLAQHMSTAQGSEERNRKWIDATKLKALRTDALPLAKSHHLQGPCSPQTALPTGAQISKYINL